MPSRPATSPPAGARTALVVLVGLVVASPWPFGSASPLARWVLTLVCLGTVVGVGLFRLWRRGGVEAPLPVVLVLAVFAFGFLQLVPLPPGFHALIAPGSAALWHPPVPEAAAVLSVGFRPISIWPEATRRASAFGLGLTALAFLSVPALRDRRQLLRASIVVVGSGLAVAVYGLVARLVFPDKLYGVFAVPTIAPFGPFVSKNHFAGYVEMAVLLALGVAAGLSDESRRTPGVFGWMGSRRAPRVVFAYGAAAVLSLAVLVSLSRGGAVSLVAGITAFSVLRSSQARAPGRGWPRSTLVGLSLVALLAGAYFILPPEARQRLRSVTAGSADSSTSFRAGIWKDSLRTAVGSPLVGYGLGTFVDALPRFKTGAADMRVEHAEDDYLELLTEGGVVGLALVLGAAVALGSRLRSHAPHGASPLRLALALGGTAGLLALAVHGLVDFNLRIPSNGLFVAFLAAVVLAACVPSRESRGGLAGLVGLSLLAFRMVTPLPSPRWIDAEEVTSLAHSHLPITALRARQLGEDLRHLVNARPGDAEAWVWLGWSRADLGRRDEGAALASYGASIDPQRRALGEAAARLSRGAVPASGGACQDLRRCRRGLSPPRL